MKYAFDKIGIAGAGSMGSEMAQLFAEKGLAVSVFDVATSNVDQLEHNLDTTDKVSDDVRQHIHLFKDYAAFVESLGGKDARKLYLLSIRHGSAADEVIQSLKEADALTKGDVILDGGNEWYRSTERRQSELAKLGVQYVGLGVSGGYQSARRGPSFSPGGDEDTIKQLLPLLEACAARDPDSSDNTPCVAYIGPAGSGHYVKMAHNGIEQGMLGVLAESWEMMFKCLHMKLENIAEQYESWTVDANSELRNTYLLQIAVSICRQPDPSGDAPHLLNRVQDKVVQDADGTEGTGFWTLTETAQRHVSAPTIAAAHFLRVASANRTERLEVNRLLGDDIGGAKKQSLTSEEGQKEKNEALKDLKDAVYCAFLAAFAQGLNLIARASADEGWGVSLATCIRIWRAGCIIQCAAIADLLQPLFERAENEAEGKGKGKGGVMNILTLPPVAEEIKRTIPGLKRTVARGVEWDAHIPTLSASLEYFKYCAGPHLPTQFMEAQLDFFGAHSYDDKSEPAGEVKKGKHHFEWKPA